MDEKDRIRFVSIARMPRHERDEFFSSLWVEYYPRLRAYLRSFSALTEDEREELTSEALMKALLKSDRYDPARPFAPWLIGVTRRLALDALKRRRNLVPFDPDSSAGYADLPSVDPETEVIKSEESRAVSEWLSTQTDRERELVRLVHAEGLSLSEVASLTGEPLGTIKWRMSEIRKDLRTALGGSHGN